MSIFDLDPDLRTVRVQPKGKAREKRIVSSRVTQQFDTGGPNAPRSKVAEAADVVILFERHEAHPDGQAWITSNSEPVAVALTEKVLAKLRGGELELIEDEAETAAA